MCFPFCLLLKHSRNLSASKVMRIGLNRRHGHEIQVRREDVLGEATCQFMTRKVKTAPRRGSAFTYQLTDSDEFLSTLIPISALCG